MSEAIKQIGIFKYDDSPTTMQYGYHYNAKLKVPFDSEERIIRVWLPEDYDFLNQEKKFPVLYFSDGQNLVNKNLTAFGDWGLDQVVHDLIINCNISFIAVGIDSPKNDEKRSDELNPPYVPKRYKKMKPKGDLFVDFIAEELKPIIDETFYTKKEKKYTGIGGSSMGGIMAFYGGVRKPNIFGFSLDFSPAFFLYRKKEWKGLLESFNIKKEDGVKYYLYVGGKKFERQFVSLTKFTYIYLQDKGFSNNAKFVFDKKGIHHEDYWHKHLGDAILFWLLD